MKLALVGKNISHSLSPLVYEDLLGKKVEYTLLDYQNEAEIPKLSELFQKYNLNGLSITSPYKRHFLEQIQGSHNLLAINTISKKGEHFYGHNTDLIAFKKQHQEFKKSHSNIKYIILGDGVMAQIIINFLKEAKVHFEQYSRKLNHDFYNTHFKEDKQFTQTIIVNCCSRDYVFKNIVDAKIIFWDLNYNHIQHQKSLSKKVELYLDGQNFLKDQAIAAIDIWLNN